MNTYIILLFVAIYFIGLLFIAYYTSRNSDNESFFNGNKKSNWLLVSFGMIGTSLSGLTFISVPATVGSVTSNQYLHGGFEYFQLVFGFFLGYFVVAYVLLPLYYKLNLTSIYTYLGQRFHAEAHKTGSIFFIISRCVGATARLYLVINVLQYFLLDAIGIPFWATTLVILLMIVLYTFEGGVKTIVITDTLQTSFMLISLLACIAFVISKLDLSIPQAFGQLNKNNYTHLFNFNIGEKTYFLKSILGGIFITIAMTGLDQEMMQKNISVKNLKDSQKNILTFAVIMLFVNLFFLFMGGLLYLYAQSNGAEYQTLHEVVDGQNVVKNLFNLKIEGVSTNVLGDDLFPSLALKGFFPMAISVIFIIGLISALFPSADGALTSLTSSFCVDLLSLSKKDINERQKKRMRIGVHLSFTLVFFLLILIFKALNNKSLIYLIMDLAGYTYGPLLGLFAFGILTKRELRIPYSAMGVCLISPFISFALKTYLFPKIGYNVGVEMILLNGLITFLGLRISSQKTYRAWK